MDIGIGSIVTISLLVVGGILLLSMFISSVFSVSNRTVKIIEALRQVPAYCQCRSELQGPFHRHSALYAQPPGRAAQHPGRLHHQGQGFCAGRPHGQLQRPGSA